MKAFTDLFTDLDQTTKTTEKVDALVRYFQSAPPADAAWAISFLIGRKPKQVVSATKLRSWAAELAGIPDWLMDECYDTVGDAAETVALILPQGDASVPADRSGLGEWVETRLLPLRGKAEDIQKSSVIAAWQQLDSRQRFVWNKLITGGFRVGVSQLLVTRALAKVAGLPTDAISHRLMGDWSPTPDFYRQLLSADASDTDRSRPYPFFLAHPLEGEIHDLGEPAEWQAEWKWDGIRAQLIRREGQTFLWTRGEELVTDRYPELKSLGDFLPDGTAIDGEILPWKDGGVQPFGQLQKRIGRKTVGKKILEEIPVVLMAYDAIETGGVDRRELPLQERRTMLQDLVARVGHPRLIASPALEFATWEALATLRAESRSRSVEGLMLKRLASPYRVGRVTGDWWKWKMDPFTVDAVLIYAQKGHGKRANLYTDYTFGVWHEEKLVTIAKAYSGLSDAEIKEVDTFVRANTLESFGPVRTVKPHLVFELGFEGIQESTRHKSGIAVRFPRMLRQRTDKSPADADTLEHIKRLIRGRSTGSV